MQVLLKSDWMSHSHLTCTSMSDMCVSLALFLMASLSSWMNQDPFLVFLIAAVPETHTDYKSAPSTESQWPNINEEYTSKCTHWNLSGWQSRRSCQISGEVWLSVSLYLSPLSLWYFSPPLSQHPSVHSQVTESFLDHLTDPHHCPSHLKQEEK